MTTKFQTLTFQTLTFQMLLAGAVAMGFVVGLTPPAVCQSSADTPELPDADPPEPIQIPPHPLEPTPTQTIALVVRAIAAVR